LKGDIFDSICSVFTSFPDGIGRSRFSRFSAVLQAGMNPEVTYV